MWSLPDIVRLNEEHDCQVCEWNGEKRKADYGYPWYDIFSDGPTGSPLEGCFTCGGCQRVFIENYTWEGHYTIVEGEQLCLPCALQDYLQEESNWIDLAAVKDVVLEPGSANEDLFDAESGDQVLARCQHLIANSMPIPSSLKFVENLEFDSTTGGLLASYSSAHDIGAGDVGVGEGESLRIIRGLVSDGHSKVMLILDGAYQFSVSIGIYVPAEEHREIMVA